MDKQTVDKVSEEILGKRVMAYPDHRTWCMFKSAGRMSYPGIVVGFNKNGLVRILFDGHKQFIALPKSNITSILEN